MIVPVKRISALKWVWDLLWSKAQIVYFLWGSYNSLFYLVAKIFRKKVVVHWIGTDVLKSQKKTNFVVRWLRQLTYKLIDLHLTDFKPLQDELKSIGINSYVIPLIADINVNQQILWPPDANRIFVYLPEFREEFYNNRIIFQLAQAMPDVEFLITQHSGKNAPQLANVKYLGWLPDIDQVWNEVKILIRITDHDGLSHSVLEALSRGKQVVWSERFPHCYYAKTFDEAKKAVDEILKVNQPNYEGKNYIDTEFNPSKIRVEINNIYLTLVKRI
jgi:glycosyltransferase involved in cell wall biosynthesis